MISELRSLHAFVLPYSIWWRNSTVAPPLLYYKILKCWKNRKGGKKRGKATENPFILTLFPVGFRTSRSSIFVVVIVADEEKLEGRRHIFTIVDI